MATLRLFPAGHMLAPRAGQRRALSDFDLTLIESGGTSIASCRSSSARSVTQAGRPINYQ
jgi:hypothetical protein